jgi:predicted NBD/HSP70 family sugar kinase
VTSRSPRRSPRVLVLDVGGSHVKAYLAGRPEVRIVSGPKMTPSEMVKQVKAEVRDAAYDVVSLGYPGWVDHGSIARDPPNLGPGWVGFDFAKAFGRPTRVVNDAAMQALASYDGGRMLFLGLGTGLGSAMIVDGALVPMELAHLPYKKGRTFEEYVGEASFERLGRKKWQKEVAHVVELLEAALEPDEVVLGGGNVRRLDRLLPGVRRGDNREAIVGGVRLWGGSGWPGFPVATPDPLAAATRPGPTPRKNPGPA